MTNPGSSQRDGLRETPPRGERRVVVHLLAADGLLSPERGLRLPRVYWTVCGEEVADSDLPHAVCPEECDCEQYYCPACLRQATVRNAETDARIAAAAGILRRSRDVHRGVFTEGHVHAVCGREFFPPWDPESDQAQCVQLPQSGQVCPACLAQRRYSTVTTYQLTLPEAITHQRNSPKKELPEGPETSCDLACCWWAILGSNQ
jgi:hypothetical protein